MSDRSRRIARRLGALCLPAVLLATGRIDASAPPQRNEDVVLTARELSDRGLRQYREGALDAAIESFEGAYAQSNRAALLFNIAQAYRLKGDCERAREFYRRYLDTSLEPAVKTAVEKRLAEMEACLKRNRQARELGTSRPDAAPVVLHPTAPAGAELARTSQMPPRADSRPPWRQPGVIAGAAGALLFAAAGVLFEREARSAEEGLSRRYAEGGMWDAAAQEQLDDGTRSRVLAVASFAAAGVSAAVATWLGIRSWRQVVSVGIAPASSSNELAIVGRVRF